MYDPRYSPFVEDVPPMSSSSTQSPLASCLPDFYYSHDHTSSQNLRNNQTLEDVFARLSVNHAPNVGAMPSQNCWMACDRDSETLNRIRPRSDSTLNPSGFLSVSSAPYELGIASPMVTLSNGYGIMDELYSGLQRKSRGHILNELLNNRSNNIPGFNLNVRRPILLQQPLSIYDLQGKMLSFATDQHGCRILQETMKNMPIEEISFIFSELIDHVIDLMMDPFGNYVVQKLVEVCSEEQRTRIILTVTRPPYFRLITICLNMHGTRAVQKLLENVSTQRQRSRIMAALSPGAVALTKDVNGHHVILHCLKHFSDEDNKHLLNMVASNCSEIAKDKSGCCVLQQCVNHAQGETKMQLLAEIIDNASHLAEDCYGNYVVQHLVSLKIPRVTESLLRQLEGMFFHLSCNKYGSNVVEKFFQDSAEQHSAHIILELLGNPKVSMLLVDAFGNYVIYSAILASQGDIRNSLLKLIELNAPMMRSNLYGKKLLSRVERLKAQHM